MVEPATEWVSEGVAKRSDDIATTDRFGPQLQAELRVWIDQDLCTGDGICTDHAPDVFVILEDGIAYCRDDHKIYNDPGGAAGLAPVPRNREKQVIDAAAECPGECIFIEFAEPPASNGYDRPEVEARFGSTVR